MALDFFKIAKGIFYSPQPAAPSSPVDGDMYYDSVLGQFQFRESGAWTTTGASPSVDDVTIEKPGGILQVKDDGITTPKILNGTVTGPKLESDINLPGTKAKNGGQQLISQAAATTNNLEILRGFVTLGGGVGDGEGFTAGTAGPTAQYNIFFTNPFGSAPTIVGCIVDGGAVAATNKVAGFIVRGATTSTGNVLSYNGSTGIVGGAAFDFIAIGPRSS